MPGILPMKVIKVGNNAQPRIAQACDRCRSKKIRCDGVRPSCSQCLNVGFECKTSDKLSRRAFPRGYTESLEERVRALEAEVKELKDLLDEKDEKIDMLSRIRSSSPRSYPSSKRSNDMSMSPPSILDSTDASTTDEHDVFKVSNAPELVNRSSRESVYLGASSTRSLTSALKQKLTQHGKSFPVSDLDSLFVRRRRRDERRERNAPKVIEAPSRLLSDRLVNIFFQEFAPLYPIVHRPTVLKLYGDFVSGTETTRESKKLAQLYLIFSIAAVANPETVSVPELNGFEAQWKVALETFSTEESLVAVQCLTLATLYFMIKADYTRMLKYKGQAVALSQRIGLHLSQQNMSTNKLECEMRKKTFWTLFTLDCFSAAHIGLGAMFNSVDVHCEYPVDADDEYVTAKGFLPSLPGESTKLSAALALFRLARIMAKILKELYPTAASYELSYRKVATLQDELDNWSADLAPHLKLHFDKDKPSTRIISDRSPLLSLAYQYVHTLISRPAVIATSSTKSPSNPSIISLASSSKKMIQISELLRERSMTYAFCISEPEILLHASFGLVFESLELGSEKNTPLINSAKSMLEVKASNGASQYSLILGDIVEELTPGSRRTEERQRKSMDDERMATAQKRGLKAFASKLSNMANPSKNMPSPRRAVYPYGMSPSAFDIEESEYGLSALFARSEPSLTPQLTSHDIHIQRRTRLPTRKMSSNENFPTVSQHTPQIPTALAGSDDVSSPADWERMLSKLDNGPSNLYDGIYGGLGGRVPSVGDYSSLASSSPKGISSTQAIDDASLPENASTTTGWSPVDLWGYSADMHIPAGAGPQNLFGFEEDLPQAMDETEIMYAGLAAGVPYGKSIMIPGVASPSAAGSAHDLDVFANGEVGYSI